ncbi:MAG: RNA methyltransferase, partial [Lachnospiraceae bacterium]|nr:RNA methyltransferase [Lachnospiraceae bacterium]
MEAPKDLIKAVYASETFIKENEGNPVGARLKEFLTESVTDEVFTKMSDTRTPQGVLCVLKRPAHDLKEIMDGKNPFIMILEDIQDPGNLGTIVRTAEGAGVTGIIMSEGCVDIFNPKTIRSTMGSIYRMPFVYVPDVVGVVKELN